MNELEKLQRARLYMNKLANGIDPISDREIPTDAILNNVRLSRCFFYVADVLRQVIDGELVTRPAARPNKPDFYITDDQRGRIEITSVSCTMTDMVKRINDITAGNQCKEFRTNWISEWLVSQGFLDVFVDDMGKNRKRATAHGESIGISSEVRHSAQGWPYLAVLLNSDAQRMVIDSIDSMISLAHEKKPTAAENQGSPWTADDDQTLVDLFGKRVPVNEIAVTLKRTESGIRAHLKRLGLIDRRPDAP